MDKITFTQLTVEDIRKIALEVAIEAVQMFNIKEDKPPATRKEAAEYLGISVPTLDILLKTEQIKSFKMGRSIRISWNEINSFVAKPGA